MERILKTANQTESIDNCRTQVKSKTECPFPSSISGNNNNGHNTSFPPQDPQQHSNDCDKQGNDDKNDVSVDDPPSLFDTLLKDPDFDSRDISITVTDFITGGIFAVSNSLTYIFYHLSHHPQVQEDLFTEIITAVSRGEKSATSLNTLQRQRISTEDISHMSLLKAVIKESFRLTSIIPAVVRILQEDTVLSGHKVPKGVRNILG
jgi:hypothetical protein